MQISAAREGSIDIVRLAGRIDHENAENFNAALAPYLAACARPNGRLLLDLSALSYISSAGLRVLMVATKTLKPAGGSLAVAAPQTMVKEVLEITRFNLVFPVFASLAEALQAFAAPP